MKRRIGHRTLPSGTFTGKENSPVEPWNRPIERPEQALENRNCLVETARHDLEWIVRPLE